MPQRKRTVVKNMLSHKQVAVNGMPVTLNSTELTPGDKVDVNLTREFRVFSNRRLKIIYEDDDIIVVDKGYGLLSMSSQTTRQNRRNSILHSARVLQMAFSIKQGIHCAPARPEHFRADDAG